ncbi:MAG: hypothetical protein HC834_01495 [Rhodospirillales bacterium]|nr:hypothetical protein [Rhodospirillales bacterium]
MQASLDTGGLALDGPANFGGDVQSLRKQHNFLAQKVIEERERIMGGNFLTRIGSLTKFNEDTMMALRRGGQSENPQVAEFAQFIRREFFEPLRKSAKEVGMKEFQDLEEEFIANYAPRIMRSSLGAQNYDQLLGILEEHFTEKLTGIWAARIEKVESRVAKLNETADILDLEPDAAADRYVQIEGEIAALPEQFDPQVREVAERVRELREQAKGATREEAKRLRAEAKAIEESNKDMLAPFQTAEKRLKGQFRLLGKSKIGIVGKNRRLVERIEATLEASDKSRDILLRKLNKLAREFEDLSEEARNRAVEDAVEQLHRAKELELRALENSVDDVPAAMARFEQADEELRELVDLDPAIAADRIESIQSELIAQGELLAAKRKAEVDRLISQLRNPNEAKAEAQAYRLKAQNTWYDLVKKGAEDNLQLERGKGVNVSFLARKYADDIAAKYMGESMRLPFFDIMGEERGLEKARLLDIDETRVWSNGAKLEDLLENDLDIVMRRTLADACP